MKFLPWFKKPPKNKKQQDMLYSETQQFDVGVTTVLVIFRDGREVHTKFYGEVDQYVRYPDGDGDIKVYAPDVITSLQSYQRNLRDLIPGYECKIVDDPINPTCAWVGMISHMEVISTASHVVEYKVQKLVEK